MTDSSFIPLCPFKQNKTVIVDIELGSYARGNTESVEFGECYGEHCALFNRNKRCCGFISPNKIAIAKTHL